ncbi:MerR family transcriptional regulator [Zunongwangia endophytica]|uniref:MerR family transcriptional regulator n=1 Tax=Zunongwangia endophytica TaxID=1808945 RepID=A0ABV8HCK5_9FLAO|nr:MerR family transcriptional regulator [Zunongwangia endophytica]MDN3596702.1 MerR family transcriptional regulator [Zunongwangia endophytica]
MELIKQSFSIKDLENLSGIKAHTIRMWEKRYNILNPKRTETNIRMYDSSCLQKILNIAFLNENGYKISRISKLTEEEISGMVHRITSSISEENRAINQFKMAMMNFDENLFNQTYDALHKKKSFRSIFSDIFLPLLNEVGLLWQTDTIKPIHEHYIVDLIKQKLYLNLADIKASKNPTKEDLFILFLPENEIHDLSILYIQYLLLHAGYQTIFLGPSLPLSNMKFLIDRYPNVKFLSYCTIAPLDIEDFIKEFQEIICENRQYELNLFGHKINNIKEMSLPENVKIYRELNNFIKTL